MVFLKEAPLHPVKIMTREAPPHFDRNQ